MKFTICIGAASYIDKKIENDEASDAVKKLLTNFMKIKSFGYDYVETQAVALSAFSEDEVDYLSRKLKEFDISLYSTNVLLPADKKIVGENVDYDDITNYIDHTFSVLSKLGVERVVFGSGGARKVPDNFNHDEAYKQLLKFIGICDEYAQKYNLIVVIEPLRSAETNIINSVLQANIIVLTNEFKNIKVLSDAYHMLADNEPFENLYSVKDNLEHVHIANRKRDYLTYHEEDKALFTRYFKILNDIGYKGGVSMEGNMHDLDEIAPKYIDILREFAESK